MIRSQRFDKELELLKESGSISVEELVEKLGISPATARRDLDALDAQGLLRRTHGGATSVAVNFDLPLRAKVGEKVAEKDAITDMALGLVEPQMVLGLSGGTTIGLLATKLVAWAQSSSDNTLNVVTNALDVAQVLTQAPGIRTIVVGGVLNGNTKETTGPFAAQIMRQLNLDLCFIGANSFTAEGPGTVDEYEASINRLMASRASRAVVLTDSSKFTRRSFVTLGGTSVVDTVITDRGIPDDICRELDGYTVLVAGE